MFINQDIWNGQNILQVLILSFSDDNGKTIVNGLYSNCEFNDVIVPPDGTRTTQWIYITRERI